MPKKNMDTSLAKPKRETKKPPLPVLNVEDFRFSNLTAKGAGERDMGEAIHHELFGEEYMECKLIIGGNRYTCEVTQDPLDGGWQLWFVLTPEGVRPFKRTGESNHAVKGEVFIKAEGEVAVSLYPMKKFLKAGGSVQDLQVLYDKMLMAVEDFPKTMRLTHQESFGYGADLGYEGDTDLTEAEIKSLVIPVLESKGYQLDATGAYSKAYEPTSLTK